MNVLLQVVEQGNLSAAGRKLGVPLTTISRKISDLEKHLGARLLQRSNRRVTLTEAGLSYLAACKRILHDVAEAELAASGAFTTARGELTLTAPVVFGRLHVLPVVTAFLQAYPEIDIRLTLADRLLHLQDDHVDVAVRIGALPDSRLRATRLGEVRRVVCASPQYLAANGLPLEPAEISRHHCITFIGLDHTDRWSFQTNGVESAMPIRSRLAVNTAEAAIDAAVSGVGLTRVLSYQITAARGAGHLMTVLEAYEPPPVPISLVFDGQGALPLKLRAFLDFAGPRIRERMVAQTG
ncbi:LysR family transcriptional regulator [Cypionkella psychrotolerans]|uniref:LysR family transcriptional regulator n=1 Tax=Cypionkella psychrotolerans TaxID=1678131 RepID=UPI001F2A16FC|nr:LysR family transcriptional regulator [Cypionkella psychrotolerans]